MIPPAYFGEYQTLVEAELRRLLPPGGSRTGESMAYTVCAPSKRVRAVLALECAALCGGRPARALRVGAAIELIHAASLILDDLPSMDDAPLRRGRPANHRQFGEAVAILAAVGLLNLALGVVAEGYEPKLAVDLVARLTTAVGLEGLIGGQTADLLATDRDIDFETLEAIHRGKTGALFVASAQAGAAIAGAAAPEQQCLGAFAKNLGLAFQIIDDLLDVEGDTAETGKAVRGDARKTTFVSVAGVAGARALASELCDTANRALVPFGRRADRLRELSGFVAGRRQ